MARLSFRCEEGLVERVDEARGMIPREPWLRRAVEQALVDDDGGVRGRSHASISGSPDQLPAPAEQPDTRAMDLLREDDPDPDFIARGRVPELPPPDPDRRRPLARSSSQAKRDVRPVPKKGER